MAKQLGVHLLSKRRQRLRMPLAPIAGQKMIKEDIQQNPGKTLPAGVEPRPRRADQRMLIGVLVDLHMQA